MRSLSPRAILLPSLLGLACVPPPGPHDGTAAQAGPAARAGDAGQVCARAAELATKDGEPAEIAAQLERDCVASLAELQGYYAQTLACMQGAADLRQLESCEGKVRGYESMFASLAPTPEQLCAHVIGMIEAELAAQVPQAQIPIMRDQCVTNSVREIREDRAAFAKKARCIMSKPNIEGMRDCELSKAKAAGLGGPGTPAPAPRPPAPAPAPAPAQPDPEPTPTPASP